MLAGHLFYLWDKLEPKDCAKVRFVRLLQAYPDNIATILVGHYFTSETNLDIQYCDNVMLIILLQACSADIVIMMLPYT